MTSSTPTARPAYAFNPRQGAASNGTYHAVLDQDLTGARLERRPGDALCKPRARFWGLEPTPHAVVTCPRCLHLAARYGVTVYDALNPRPKPADPLPDAGERALAETRAAPDDPEVTR